MTDDRPDTQGTARSTPPRIVQTVLDTDDATTRLDRSDDAEEPLFVLTDPSGHPFCIFVSVSS